MAPKPKPKQSTPQPHPQIEEIGSLQDFQTYTGIADLPGVPLVQQIEHLQREAARRKSELKSRHGKSATTEPKSRNVATTTYSGKDGNAATTRVSVPSRYRNRRSAVAKEKTVLRDEDDGEDTFEEEYEEEEIRQPDGTIIKRRRIRRKADDDEDDEEDEDEEEGKVFFAILEYTQLLIPLLTAHIIFDILVNVQYAQDITFENVAAQLEILQRAGMAAPVLLMLHLFCDPWKETRLFRWLSFFASVGIGYYLVYIANEEGYYFVMKRAPPLGTIWVWMFIVMHWAYAAASLVVVFFWVKLKGYSF